MLRGTALFEAGQSEILSDEVYSELVSNTVQACHFVSKLFRTFRTLRRVRSIVPFNFIPRSSRIFAQHISFSSDPLSIHKIDNTACKNITARN